MRSEVALALEIKMGPIGRGWEKMAGNITWLSGVLIGSWVRGVRLCHARPR